MIVGEAVNKEIKTSVFGLLTKIERQIPTRTQIKIIENMVDPINEQIGSEVLNDTYDEMSKRTNSHRSTR